MTKQKKPYKRRIFLIKQGFQLKFLLTPVIAFSLFTIAAGYYLHTEMSDTLTYYMYLPHSDIENLWGEIYPPILDVILWGGLICTASAGLWAWRRSARLRKDITRLEVWSEFLKNGQAPATLPRFKEKEIFLLGKRLGEASSRMDGFHEELNTKIGEILEDAKALEPGSGEEVIHGLARLRAHWKETSDFLNGVRIDEELS